MSKPGERTKSEAADLNYDPAVFDAAEYMTLSEGERITRGLWNDAQLHDYADEVEFTYKSARRHRARRYIDE